MVTPLKLVLRPSTTSIPVVPAPSVVSNQMKIDKAKLRMITDAINKKIVKGKEAQKKVRIRSNGLIIILIEMEEILTSYSLPFQTVKLPSTSGKAVTKIPIRAATHRS